MAESALRALTNSYLMGIGQGELQSPRMSGEQAAYLAAQFAPGAATADAAGLMPAMPSSEQDFIEAALSGQYNPSLRQNLQQGNYLDALLQGLGVAGDAAYAIPLAGIPIGAAMKAPKAIRNAARASDALDMSKAARMQRADAMEYLPETVYHGTAADIESFRPATYGGSVTKARSAKMGTWFSDNPEVSAGYARFAAEDVPVQRLIDKADEAGREGNFDLQEKLYLEAEQLELGRSLQDGGGQNIIPARIRGKMFEVDAEGATMSDLDDSQLYQWAQEAKSKGYDGLKIKNFSDNADYGQYLPATHYLVFDPANIRSINAAFDPAKRSSANLMAGVGGAAVGLSALNQLVPRNEERRPD